ncbi:Multiple epidermal growth factor-like domains protein 8 [Apophysomyces sp. BC1021]|nr:Multiple epidermal growth factor-like domains protein 8 [Apophysomyces sp. BC1021]
MVHFNNVDAYDTMAGFGEVFDNQAKTIQCSGQQTLAAMTTPDVLTLHNYRQMECQWTIATPEPNRIIKITFNYFHLACGYDFLMVYDGQNTSDQMVAKLCGWRDDYNDTILSTSSSITLGLTSNRNGLAKSFQAVYSAIVGMPSDIFTPRSRHAAIYYRKRDSMIVSGGMTLNGLAQPELLEFHFTNMSWTLPSNESHTRPTPRYGQTLFLYNESVYSYGGQTVLGIEVNDLWRLDPETWNWTKVVYTNKPPPVLVQPTRTPVTLKNQSTYLFIFGGYRSDATSGAYISRSIYALDMATYTWISNLRQNSVGAVAATGVYYAETDSIYYFGGQRDGGSNCIYQYHIPSNLWFLDQVQEMYTGRVYGAATMVGDHSAVFVGGQCPNSSSIDERHNTCFYADRNVYDFACGTWTTDRTIHRLSEPSYRRMGHSMIVRGNTAWVLGGYNGFDLGDMFSFPLPPTNTNETELDQCKGGAAIITIVMTAYLGHIVLTAIAHAKMPSKQTGMLHWTQRPAHFSLRLNQTFKGLLPFGKSMDFKTFIDQPNADIHFSILPTNPNFTIYFRTLNQNGKISLPFNMTQLTNRSMRDIEPLNGESPRVQFPAHDPRRFSGYYVYSLFTDTGSNDQNGTEIQFSLRIDAVSTSNRSDLPDAVIGQPRTATIVTIVIFVVFGTLLVAIGVAFGRSCLLSCRRRRRQGQVGDESGLGSRSQDAVPVSAIYSVLVDEQHEQTGSQRQPMVPLDNRGIQPLSVQRYIQDDPSSENLYMLQYAIILPTPPSAGLQEGHVLPRIVIGSTLAEPVLGEEPSR